MTQAKHRQDTQSYHKEKQEWMLKNTRFNRYMMQRYSIALFFFSNLYWLLMQFFNLSIFVVFPIMLLLLAICAMAEQVRLYGADDVGLKWTRHFFISQLATQVLILLFVLLRQPVSLLFPMFSNHQSSYYLVLILGGIGVLVSVVNLFRIKAITEKKDKAYSRIKQLEKYI